MSNYVVGDVQGCLTGLKKLLDEIQFSDNDRLYLVGDLINRGPASLETLRFIKSLNNAKTVLGNHDLHLLAVYFNVRQSQAGDTLDDILTAKDAPELIDWLIEQPLMLLLKQFDAIIVHAGIHPHWALEQALTYATEISDALASDLLPDILKDVFGNHPNRWDDSLTGVERLRCLINYFTRMRFCKADGTLDFTYKGNPPHQDPTLKPWFTYPLAVTETILFGHWAAMNGNLQHQQVIGLDTGYVWGNQLTAIRLEDRQFFSIQHVE